MTKETFFYLLKTELDLPFEIIDVRTVESNCGTTWIELYDGTMYYLTSQACENAEEG